jgi:hypothetical protein
MFFPDDADRDTQTSTRPGTSSSPADSTSVAALAVHLMTNTALSGATCDVDGGQQRIEA